MDVPAKLVAKSPPSMGYGIDFKRLLLLLGMDQGPDVGGLIAMLVGSFGKIVYNLAKRRKMSQLQFLDWKYCTWPGLLFELASELCRIERRMLGLRFGPWCWD